MGYIPLAFLNSLERLDYWQNRLSNWFRWTAISWGNRQCLVNRRLQSWKSIGNIISCLRCFWHWIEQSEFQD